MTFERTTISLPKGLKQRAKDAGIKISRAAARAILNDVEVMEASKHDRKND